jgi:hypothetical protein
MERFKTRNHIVNQWVTDVAEAKRHKATKPVTGYSPFLESFLEGNYAKPLACWCVAATLLYWRLLISLSTHPFPHPRFSLSVRFLSVQCLLHRTTALQAICFLATIATAIP